MINGEAVVTAVERISPSFLRVEFGGPDLAEFGVDGPTLDQRIKLLFGPDQQRSMRTYSIRAVRPGPRLVVDFVLHLTPGSSGPASRWAAAAEVGDTVGIIAPRRGHYFGGIEFHPGRARRLLLAGDETAVPAISAILEQLDRDAVGAAYLEIPSGADRLPINAPPGIGVRWLPRHGAPHGSQLVAAVREHSLLSSLVPTPAGAMPAAILQTAVSADEVDPNLWETPAYSSSGESISEDEPLADTEVYAWVAGESRAVTTIRRHLVQEAGIDRRQVAFMGYWREGVAMKG